jgi:uncharacterized protein YtpQ (UPF0354 family)
VRRLTIVVVALAMVACAVAASAETLNPQAFTAAFAAAATAAMPDAKVAIAGDLHLETRGARGGTTTTDLHNAYEVYLADPSRLDTVIKRYVALLAETVGLGGATRVDRLHVVPVLKSTGWVETVQQQREAVPKAQLLTEPFNSDLMIVYAEDLPSSIRFLVTRDDVGDRASLRDRAVANLRRLLPKIEMRAGAHGVSIISAGGEYEASLLLLDDLWSSGQFKVDGDIVAAAPTKDILLVTGSRNAAGIAWLREAVRKLTAGPYSLTPSLFVYRGGKFVRFDES